MPRPSARRPARHIYLISDTGAAMTISAAAARIAESDGYKRVSGAIYRRHLNKLRRINAEMERARAAGEAARQGGQNVLSD